MDCTVPGQFSAERLLAFANGEHDEALAAHLPSCVACAEAVAGYSTAEQVLRTMLYRIECATTLELGELTLDLLQPERATIVRAHLAGCPYCGAEFTGLRNALRTDPLLDLVPRPSPIRRLIARLLSQPTEVMAYGMVDTIKHEPARIYEVEGVRVSLTLVHEAGEAPHQWTLRGTVADRDEAASPVSTVSILLNGRPISERPIESRNNFVISGLGEQTYDLQLHLTNRLIVIEDLQVGAEWELPRS